MGRRLRAGAWGREESVLMTPPVRVTPDARERIENARERWREIAPPALRALLDAKPTNK